MQVADERSRPKSIVGADFIRLMAAALVVIFHLGYLSWAELGTAAYGMTGGAVRNEWAAPFAWFGWVGVHIFFVLSGFVIAFSVRDRAGKFVRRRALRLIPAAWICAPIALLAVASMTDKSIVTLILPTIRSMVFWPTGTWIDNVFWTLPIEIAFYSFVAIVIKVRGASAVPVALFGLGLWSLIYWTIRMAASFTGESFMPLPDPIMNLTLAPVGGFFAVGGLLYHYLCRQRSLTLLIGIAIAFGASILSLTATSIGEAKAFDNATLAAVPLVVWTLSVALLVASVLMNDFFATARISRWSREAGIMTYPLYLIHNSVGSFALRIGDMINLPAPVSLLAAIFLAFCAAFAIARYGEPPLRAALGRGLDRVSRPARLAADSAA